jgi:hypothetical protein
MIKVGGVSDDRLGSEIVSRYLLFAIRYPQ